MKKSVLLAGGTGLVGTRLAAMLLEKGYQVRILSRKPVGNNEFAWDPLRGYIDDSALEGVDAVINLTGAGIAEKRWTPERKRLLIESRVQSAHVLRDAFQRTRRYPACYLSASAIGYYGNAGDRMMYEADPPGPGFMPECCVAWEQAAETVSALGIRTVILRIGIVLAREGGALAEFVKPLRFGLGTYFGDGQGWYSWIHRDDLCRIFLHALENDNMEGVFNAVAPHPARNGELVRATGKAMRQPALYLPAPALALRIALGEMSAVVLDSVRVSADKLLSSDFHFQYPDLDQALHNVLARSRP